MLLITKFNKLIRNKLIWAVFAICISIGFVATGLMQKGSAGDDNNRRGKEGKIFEVEISSSDFYTARYFLMGFNDSSSFTPEQNKMLRQKTWERMASIEKAKQLGISASDEEVREKLKNDRNFAVNGTFSSEKYLSLISAQLRREPSNAAQLYEESLRQGIILNKLDATIRAAVWTSPTEVNRRLHDLMDMFTVEYALISKEIDEDTVVPDEARVKEFFEKNIELFRVPEKVSVRYVEFPVDQYQSKIEIADESITEYYTQNAGEYTSVDTNGAPTLSPIDEVRDDIIEKIKHNTAIRSAQDAADGLIRVIQPNRRGEAPDFNKTVSSLNLNVQTSEFFTISGPVPGIENASSDFLRSAFALDKSNINRYFSDPIVSSNSVFILAAEDTKESHLPELKDVNDSVVEYAKIEMLSEKRLDASTKVHEEVKKNLQEGQTFTESITSLGFNVSTTEPFNVLGGIATNDFDNSDVIIRGVVSLSKGDITELLNTYDGSYVAYITDRQLGDALTMQSLRPRVIYTDEGYSLSNLFDDWAEQLLVDAGFEDYNPIRTISSEEEEEEESL